MSELLRGARDYACKSCGMEYEYFHWPQGENKDQEPECPKCQSHDAERLINKNTSHVLKGFGWYRDGY